MLLGVSFPDNEAAAASAEEAKDGGQWLSKKAKKQKSRSGVDSAADKKISWDISLPD